MPSLRLPPLTRLADHRVRGHWGPKLKLTIAFYHTQAYLSRTLLILNPRVDLAWCRIWRVWERYLVSAGSGGALGRCFGGFGDALFVSGTLLTLSEVYFRGKQTWGFAQSPLVWPRLSKSCLVRVFVWTDRAGCGSIATEDDLRKKQLLLVFREHRIESRYLLQHRFVCGRNLFGVDRQAQV